MLGGERVGRGLGNIMYVRSEHSSNGNSVTFFVRLFVLFVMPKIT